MISKSSTSSRIMDKTLPLPLPTPATHAQQLANDPDSTKLSSVFKEYEEATTDDVGDICDFCFGNPQEYPPSELVDVFRAGLTPKTPKYFAYRSNESDTTKLLARSAAKRYRFEHLDPDDVFLTTGNFAGLALALQLVTNPEDNVIYMEPGWFAYRRLILNARCKPRPVKMPLTSAIDDDTGDMLAILDAIDENTKVIILNQPHNPTGKVYSRAWLEKLADALLTISKKRGYPLYILSDEAYSDFVFDEGKHETIGAIYPYTLIAYTYNKMTLAPSQRVGYLLVSPLMPGREVLRDPLFSLQVTLTWCFPNADVMESIPQLEKMRDEFNVKVMEEKRNKMLQILEGAGYELLVKPKGTFYVLVKSPIEDDREFCRQLAKRKVWVLPGLLFNTPGCFRICLTATNEMIERSIGVLQECFRTSFD